MKTYFLSLLMVCQIALLSACVTPIVDTTDHQLALVSQPPTEYPGAPTVLRLLLRRDAGQFDLLGLSAKRDSIIEPDIAANMDKILDGSVLLYGYEALDSQNQVISEGEFLVSLVARVEFLDDHLPHAIRRQEQRLVRPLVTLSVPYDENIISIRFTYTDPSRSMAMRAWKTVPFGDIEIDLMAISP